MDLIDLISIISFHFTLNFIFIRIAELTKENLQSQRQSLRMIQQKMNTLARKYHKKTILMNLLNLKLLLLF